MVAALEADVTVVTPPVRPLGSPKVSRKEALPKASNVMQVKICVNGNATNGSDVFSPSPTHIVLKDDN
jgi:hypothetical protein